MTEWRRNYTSFARFAFLDALRIGGVKPGDTVLVPAFICRDVLAPIHAVGAKIDYYQLDERLRPIAASLTGKPRAILAVDYFGFPQQLDALRRFATANEAVIIEDNAHGLFSKDELGVPLGERTGIGFTSFRKTIRVVNGAFLSVDIDSFPGAMSLLSTQPAVSHNKLPLGFRVRRAVSAVQSRTGWPIMNHSRGLVRHVRSLSGRPSLPMSLESETELPNDRRIHVSALRALEAVSELHECERRRHLYLRIADRLREVGVEPLFENLSEHTVPWCVPYYATVARATQVQRVLNRLGVETFPWPDLPSRVRDSCPVHYHRVNLVSMLR